ncbi:MAG: exodeoxyribonuclease V subunit alpha [Desulfocapsaceae bacterium]|nr:exodeoxyribonuclease V subunit alpha [Desulfocapsaceae bacterium]
MVEQRENLLGFHIARMLVGKAALAAGERNTFRRIIEKLMVYLDEGHSCMAVAEDEEELLKRSLLVSEGDLTPLVLVNQRLYLHRYYRYEYQLAEKISSLAGRPSPAKNKHFSVKDCFSLSGVLNERQQEAVELALQKALVIVSGGPGTGKTSTVVAIIGAHVQAMESATRVALAAPTGKAAARLGESVQESLRQIALPESVLQALPEKSQTLHRLLGVRRNSPRFYHDRNNPLPWDLVVVDEASMVDLALMSKLVDALHSKSCLVLLGDKDQLASVESGAVLAELTESLPDNTVMLSQSYRFNTAIREFADAVKIGDEERAWNLIGDSASAELGFLEIDVEQFLLQKYRIFFDHITHLDPSGYTGVFKKFNAFRVLCATRKGNLGVENINLLIEHRLKKHYGHTGTWYPGRPVMITRNDYNLGLYNGDIGICLPDRDETTLKVWFESEDGNLRGYLPHRLPEHLPAYSITIHKSQGSEFDEVAVLLPDKDTPVLCREIIYTAITRGRKKVWMHCEQEIFRLAVARKTRRYSGLAEMVGQKRRDFS